MDGVAEEELDGEEVGVGELLDELDVLVDDVVEDEVVLGGGVALVWSAGVELWPGPFCRPTNALFLSTFWNEGRRCFPCVSDCTTTNNGANNAKSERGASRIAGHLWDSTLVMGNKVIRLSATHMYDNPH